MSRVDIDHDQAGDGTGHDSDASLRPLAKPAARFRLTGVSMLKLLPADQRSLISCPDRDSRPASSHVLVNRLVDRDHWVNPSVRSNPRVHRHDRTRCCARLLPHPCHAARQCGSPIAVASLCSAAAGGVWPALPALARTWAGAYANRRERPPPPTRSTTKRPPFSESSTSLEPPLTRDWRGRQRARSGSRAAPPETDLGSARAFQARDTRRSGHVARRLRPRGRCCSCLRVTEGRRREWGRSCTPLDIEPRDGRPGVACANAMLRLLGVATPERPRQHSRRSTAPDGVEADHLPFAYTSTAASGPSWGRVNVQRARGVSHRWRRIRVQSIETLLFRVVDTSKTCSPARRPSQPWHGLRSVRKRTSRPAWTRGHMAAYARQIAQARIPQL